MPRSPDDQGKLDRSILVDYFGRERLGINDRMISKGTEEMERAVSAWPALIDRSFLSPELKLKCKDLVKERAARLWTA